MTEKRVTLPRPYAPLLNPEIREIVEPSGRSSGKTTSNEVAAICKMLDDGRNNIWYCRAETGDIRTTIFTSMVSTIQMMGLDSEFSTSVSPFTIRAKRTGATCYFSGINGKVASDVTQTKGFTPQGRTLAMCILDEADQVKHPDHVTGWVSTATRFLLPDSKIIYAYNPPMSRSHWAHKFYGDKVRNGATKIYATWQDVRKLLSIAAIREIEKFQREDPDYYKYWYLGQPVDFKGMVYPQFKRETHCINVFDWMIQRPFDKASELIFGLDEGTVNDSTCVTPLLIMLSGIAIALDCLEIDPLVIGQQSPAEASRLLIQFLADTLGRFPFVRNIPRRWIFECAEGGQMLRLQFYQDSGENTLLVTNKSVMGDIKRVRSMLSERILLFNTSQGTNTMQLVEDIEGYVFDERTGDVKKQQRDDTIDSLEYATKLYYDAPISA